MLFSMALKSVYELPHRTGISLFIALLACIDIHIAIFLVFAHGCLSSYVGQ